MYILGLSYHGMFGVLANAVESYLAYTRVTPCTLLSAVIVLKANCNFYRTTLC